MADACDGFSRGCRRQWIDCSTSCRKARRNCFRRTDRQHIFAFLLALLAIGIIYYSGNKSARVRFRDVYDGVGDALSSYSVWAADELNDALKQIEDLDQLSSLQQKIEEGSLFTEQLERMKRQLQDEIRTQMPNNPYNPGYGGNYVVDEHQQQLQKLQQSVDLLSQMVSDTVNPDNQYANLQEQLSRQESKMVELQSNLNSKFDSIENKISNIKPSPATADSGTDRSGRGATQAPPNPDLSAIETRIRELEQAKADLENSLTKLETDTQNERVSEELIESIVQKKLDQNYNDNSSKQIDWISAVVDHSQEHLEGNAADRISSWMVGTGNNPDMVLRESDKIGDCYPLQVDKATAGWMEFKLLQHIVPRQVMIYHIDHRETPMYATSPQKFWVLGSNNRRNWKQLGKFEYKGNTSSRQLFNLNNPDESAYEYIRLEIKTNRGAKYTCLYQFAVHGELPKRIGFVETSDQQPSI